MSKLLYLDCATGIAGDMLLASLLELGLDKEALLADLRCLPLGEWEARVEPAARGGISGLHLDFIYPHQHHHRRYGEIKEMIRAMEGQWPTAAREKALAIFAVLAEAEAAVHGCPVEEVHFHEVGAVDSLLDICGAALALTRMEIDGIYFSELPLSRGFIDCEHGRLPVPAPATARLMAGWQLTPVDIEGETVTPTGAAILKGCGGVQRRPDMKLLAVGCGVGSKDFPGYPNVLRAFLGEAAAAADGPESDRVDVLRTNIDDASGELLGQLWQAAFDLGALDMSYTPLLMKKGRPGWALEMIVPAGRGPVFAGLIFHHTTSIGLRICEERRLKLPRRQVTVETPYGPVEIKVSGDTAAPEAEQTAKAAADHNVSFKQVYAAALAAYLHE